MVKYRYPWDYWSADSKPFRFDFGPKLPNLDQTFSKKEFGQIHAHRRELINNGFTSLDTINKLLWLWFGIDDKAFECLCAYFTELELGYNTDIRGGFLDKGIDVSGCRGPKSSPEFIAIQCKQWNSWNISEPGISKIYNKMAHARIEHNARLLIATTNYLSNPAWDFVEDNTIDVWDYKSMLEYYDKYFSDPDTWWEKFQYFVDKKKMIQLANKQRQEHEESETRKDKQHFWIKRESIALRSDIKFEILRDVRKKEATKHGIYPNYVFSDTILYEMIKRRPQTRLEFLRISWIGEEKYKKYCTAFAEVIRSFKD